MTQSKKSSLLEAICNTGVSITIAVIITQLFVEFGIIDMTLSNNFLLTITITFCSILRAYLIRRMFNKHIEKD